MHLPRRGWFLHSNHTLFVMALSNQNQMDADRFLFDAKTTPRERLYLHGNKESWVPRAPEWVSLPHADHLFIQTGVMKGMLATPWTLNTNQAVGWSQAGQVTNEKHKQKQEKWEHIKNTSWTNNWIRLHKFVVSGNCHNLSVVTPFELFLLVFLLLTRFAWKLNSAIFQQLCFLNCIPVMLELSYRGKMSCLCFHQQNMRETPSSHTILVVTRLYWLWLWLKWPFWLF